MLFELALWYLEVCLIATSWLYPTTALTCSLDPHTTSEQHNISDVYLLYASDLEY